MRFQFINISIYFLLIYFSKKQKEWLERVKGITTKVYIDYAKAFDCVDHNKLWEILKEMGIPDHLTCPWETYMQVRKQQLELNMEQQTGSK